MTLPHAHPKASKYRVLSAARLQDLADDIGQNGQQDPIVFSAGPASEGFLIDGRNRWLACELAGLVPDVIKIHFETDADIVAFIESKNDFRRHLTQEEEESNRQERIARVVASRQAGKSLRAIASEQGVSLGQVQRDLATVSPDTVDLPTQITGNDGRTRTATPRLSISTPQERSAKSGQGMYDAAEAKQKTPKDTRTPEEIKAQCAASVEAHFAKVGELHPTTLLPSEAPAPTAPSEAPRERSVTLAPGVTIGTKRITKEELAAFFADDGSTVGNGRPGTYEPADAPKGAPAIMASGRDDHNTPPEILEVVRRFSESGHITLDPCSNQYSLTEAEVRLTKEEDGLSQDWTRYLALDSDSRESVPLVFVNPPFDQKTLAPTARRCRDVAAAGADAVLLVPVKSDQIWFQHAIIHMAAAVCFIEGRVPFWCEGQEQQGAAFPCCLFYFGTRATAFQFEFAGTGAVVVLLGAESYRKEGQS